ncbi:hypothetical protein Patl1_12033 [Pistacia atlantica]|uniref:Uncharacterized protein n=1 Tax=Pistacia atlantica TaxID=434234 RepID=A0ACC1A6K5_9ROSI|nr:hypothetical protein Patl1_12033 [Pistacia atlantica]
MTGNCSCKNVAQSASSGSHIKYDENLTSQSFFFLQLHDFPRPPSQRNLGRVFDILGEMEERGITPSKVTYTILIDAFARSDHMEKAFQIHAFMEKAGLVPDVYTYGVLIHGLCMKGNMKEASKLFKSMSEMQLEANDVVYNMMIHRYCKEDNSYRALRLVKEMDEKGLVPNVASYSSTIGVLCKYGKWQEAEVLLNEMIESGSDSMGKVKSKLFLPQCALLMLCIGLSPAERKTWIKWVLASNRKAGKLIFAKNAK